MTIQASDLAAGAAILLFGVLVSPVRHSFEASMTAQMLLQIPLLVAVGALGGAAMPKGVLRRWIVEWNHQGVSGLLLASIVGGLWLLPRLLDSAVVNPAVDAARYVTLPLLVGLPLALSWPQAGFITRGVIALEFVATLFRMGWAYLVWPSRLCNNYLIEDQQWLGKYLLLLGVWCSLQLLGQLLWGRFEASARQSSGSAS